MYNQCIINKETCIDPSIKRSYSQLSIFKKHAKFQSTVAQNGQNRDNMFWEIKLFFVSLYSSQR